MYTAGYRAAVIPYTHDNLRSGIIVCDLRKFLQILITT